MLWILRRNKQYPTWNGSKVPWTLKSMTPPEDCRILPCLTRSRWTSQLSSTGWLTGKALSSTRVAGDPRQSTGNTATAMRNPARPKAAAILNTPSPMITTLQPLLRKTENRQGICGYRDGKPGEWESGFFRIRRQCERDSEDPEATIEVSNGRPSQLNQR